MKTGKQQMEGLSPPRKQHQMEVLDSSYAFTTKGVATPKSVYTLQRIGHIDPGWLTQKHMKETSHHASLK